jgi:hypothetical protein
MRRYPTGIKNFQSFAPSSCPAVSEARRNAPSVVGTTAGNLQIHWKVSFLSFNLEVFVSKQIQTRERKRAA